MSERLTVDWTACRARGVCSELLPERIDLDEWGYPLLDPTPVTGSVADFARQAVAACPTRALRLEPAPSAVTRRPSTPAPRPAHAITPGEAP